VPETRYRIRSIGDVTKINTNILSIGLVGIIALCIVIAIGVKAFLGMMLSSNEHLITPAATPITTPTTLVEDRIVSPATQEALRVSLTTLHTNGTIREIRLVDENGTPLSKETLLTLFGFTNNSLNRTVIDIHLIAQDQNYGLVFTVTDTTAAFGSLLLEEIKLATSVTPALFSTSVNGAITTTDETVHETDVRVLSSETSELLVYGFISTNTILITHNTAMFSALTNDID
jgi:hypothetical protein